MVTTAHQREDVFMPLGQRLAANADGVLEDIARTYCVSTLDVVHALPEANRKIVSADRFEVILEAVASWGPILFIVHTPDLVLECEGPLPPGSYGRGYFNLHGASPIGGHIRASRCREIAFVTRPFMGRESRSIQFFNFDGDAMFKIFVRRDENHNLIAEQVARFDTLKAAL
ncbi:heme utilization cystosolic carrier protein HutX [Hyphomicrobium sp.]|uniref:heme utilization cystosolic carrier protein HutX n=1 Tax=Hyphomicrobium sp. TaxID=82 RepID=UPI0025BCD09E|nr:heme utilization cystosolic carrier protein HutX [Hyphomicrobium sp.]MCC7250540.1 heme utilization cystosolic carrier protein HutX [Hyphomicrobium sp.]